MSIVGRRAGVLAALLLTAVLAGFGGYMWAGGQTATQAEVVVAADEPVYASVPVERRAVSQSETVTGEGVAGAVTSVWVKAPPGSDYAVVTDRRVQVGETLESGTPLGVVSGRPIFALEVGVRPYRDLMRGDAGVDVESLQRALQSLGYEVPVHGRFDWLTEQALTSFYSDRDSVPPREQYAYFAMSEFVFVVDEAPTVATIADINTLLDDDTPFVTLQTSPPSIMARLTVVEAEQFDLGSPVVVESDGWQGEGTVTSIGPFEHSDDGEVAGVDLTVHLDPGGAEVAPGEVYSINSVSEDVSGLAVPLAAVRYNSDGTFVVEELSDGTTSEVLVHVVAERDGWAVLGADSGLDVGSVVRVS